MSSIAAVVRLMETLRGIDAAWDPWRDLHTHREELSKSDIYCLRRIVPEDRGQKWS